MGNSSSDLISVELTSLLRHEPIGEARLFFALLWRSSVGSIFHELVRSELVGGLEHLLDLCCRNSTVKEALAASINYARPSDGATPLIMAAAMGAERTCSILLAHGANPFLADKTSARRTALHWAALKNHHSLIEPLVRASDAFAVQRGGSSSGAPKFLAEQQCESVPFVDLQTRSAWTALHYAAWCNNWRCARALIRMGASIHERRRGRWRSALIGFASPSNDQTLGNECPHLCTALHLCALRGAYRTARTILAEHLMIISSETTWLTSGYRLSREPLLLRQYDPRMMVDAARATPYNKLGQSSLISLRRNRALMLRITLLLNPQTPLLYSLGGADELTPRLVLSTGPQALGALPNTNIRPRDRRGPPNSHGPIPLAKIAALAMQKKLISELDGLKVELLEKIKSKQKSKKLAKEHNSSNDRPSSTMAPSNRLSCQPNLGGRNSPGLSPSLLPYQFSHPGGNSPSLDLLEITMGSTDDQNLDLEMLDDDPDISSLIRGGSVTSTRLKGINEEGEGEGEGSPSQPLNIMEPWPVVEGRGGSSTTAPTSPFGHASSHWRGPSLSRMRPPPPPPLILPSPNQIEWFGVTSKHEGSTTKASRMSRASSKRSMVSLTPSTAFSDDHASTCGVCLDDGRDGEGIREDCSVHGLGFVLIRPCNHKICHHCARELIGLHFEGFAPCPFCRGNIKGFCIY
jgi:ankyrin repeat protein